MATSSSEGPIPVPVTISTSTSTPPYPPFSRTPTSPYKQYPNPNPNPISNFTTHPHSTTNSHAHTPTKLPRRFSMPKIDRKVESLDVVQGRILWLPAKEELAERAVRRAHGKGAIEEGIYNHPVVVISRPVEEGGDVGGAVHFHLITSFGNKRLNEIYGKANDFQASRRSWYLPIAPTEDHPDAQSKKSRKRFPTLLLANDAELRWKSYVNIRHVYKTEWTYLKPYANPEMPLVQNFRFERDSLIQMLAKSRVLTLYEPGPQFQSARAQTYPVIQQQQQQQQQTSETQSTAQPPTYPSSPPTPTSTTSPISFHLRGGGGGGGGAGAGLEFYPQSPISDTASIADSEYSAASALLQSDFSDSKRTCEASLVPQPKAPPDAQAVGVFSPDREILASRHARLDSSGSSNSNLNLNVREEGADCGCFGYVIKRLLYRPVVQH